MIRGEKNKDVPLEALRGLAAVSVVAWHLIFGFFPACTGAYDAQLPGCHLNGQPWFGLVNGPAAVDFFFVLSGFVLTRRALATGDEMSLVRGALKRWPRLAGPITLTVLLSYALFRLGGYDFVRASSLTHSPWLASFGNAPKGGPVEITFFDALKKGVYSVLFSANYSYDTSLWTMPIEFRGSFLALGLALALVQLRRAAPLASGYLAVALALAVWTGCDVYLTFVAGVLLAAATLRWSMRLPPVAVGALCLLGLYLEGYYDGRGAYRWLSGAVGHSLSGSDIHLIGSVALIMACEGSAGLRRTLSGRWAAFLGAISFPVYLVHVLMICSVGSATLVGLNGVLPSPWPTLGACLASILATLAAAVPMARFDAWWMRQVNYAVKAVSREATFLARPARALPETM